MNTPTNDPTNIAPAETIAVTTHTVASLAELLAMSEEFLRTAGPLIHAELRTYLDHRCPPADPSWFIDMLGFNSLHLSHLLPAGTAPPSETWQHQDHDDQMDQEMGQEEWA